MRFPTVRDLGREEGWRIGAKVASKSGAAGNSRGEEYRQEASWEGGRSRSSEIDAARRRIAAAKGKTSRRNVDIQPRDRRGVAIARRVGMLWSSLAVDDDQV